MDHDRAERLISERLDGERSEPREVDGLEQHLQGCVECRAFERAAWRLREAARFEVAQAVPDLVEPIMSAVEHEAGSRRAFLRVVRHDERRSRRRILPRLAPAVAALLAGMLVGSVVVGGPWRDEPPRGGTALASADVTREIAAAAAGLDAYEARFAITERNLSDKIAERRLTMRVWFRAPERFRLDVIDRTDYPSPATPTDLRLIVNDDAWYAVAPTPCAKATCPPRETTVVNRVPFSSAAAAPTDLVLPLTALARPESFTVLGRATVHGRPAVGIEVPFTHAEPLFPFLSLGGDWRPFFPNDRVRVWLDERDWFPLRWEVFPAVGHQRDQWALRFGLPEEPSLQPVFEVEALSVSRTRPAVNVFSIPRTDRAEDQGATAVSPDRVATAVGFEPVAPADPAGLDLYRVVLPAPDEPDAGETLLTYADGLSFLKVGETRSWGADAPFGPVGVRAEEVALTDGGIAYYEPATGLQGRRLSIHAAGTDLYLETNLSRDRLLAVASSLPVTGLPMPEAWRLRQSKGAVVERVTLEEAAAAVPFDIGVPTELPVGLGLASVELIRIGDETAVTLYLRDTEIDLGAGSVRLHVEPAAELPAVSSAKQATVRVAGVEGRWTWTPERSLLEWVSGGVYRSLDATGLGLEELLRIAESTA